MAMFWVFDVKGGVVVVSNTKNASRRTGFACLCEPGLEGVCRVDGKDPNTPPFMCLGLRREDKTTNTQIVPMGACFRCLL